MDPEYFEGLTDADIAELLDGYNAWHRGETGETCGDPTDDYIGMEHIGDDMWMAYLAAVIGRKSDQPSALQRLRSLLDRVQPYLRHIPDVTHTEIEELRAALREPDDLPPRDELLRDRERLRIAVDQMEAAYKLAAAERDELRASYIDAAMAREKGGEEKTR
jgi:hypothetical protein